MTVGSPDASVAPQYGWNTWNMDDDEKTAGQKTQKTKRCFLSFLSGGFLVVARSNLFPRPGHHMNFPGEYL